MIPWGGGGGGGGHGHAISLTTNSQFTNIIQSINHLHHANNESQTLQVRPLLLPARDVPKMLLLLPRPGSVHADQRPVQHDVETPGQLQALQEDVTHPLGVAEGQRGERDGGRERFVQPLGEQVDGLRRHLVLEVRASMRRCICKRGGV